MTNNNCYQTKWTKAKGVDVLAIDGLTNIVAVPVTGRKNAAVFAAIDVAAGEELCQMPKADITTWLCAVARREGVPYNAKY